MRPFKHMSIVNSLIYVTLSYSKNELLDNIITHGYKKILNT